ncbi:hypothetical protein LAZ67_4000196 [Cordylochernes scorpioides]|uniref:Ig-like domain-containing protein n=1 Tax=Cordylochernes scorpioides TaxID=51811 RepID=A0ABY6KBE1_9ARAC|nr:hypothetical protein LAZ67_4000196 [Cordylochernes scorpioides]
MIPRCHTVGRSTIAAGLDLSPRRRHTRTRRLSLDKQKRDSSENTTLCHSVIHVDLARHHSKRWRLFGGVNGSLLSGRHEMAVQSVHRGRTKVCISCDLTYGPTCPFQSDHHAPQYTEVSAVSGSEVRLPCNTTSHQPGDSASMVLWYRGDSGTPIYSVDSRDSSDPKHFASEVLGSRASFLFLNGSSSALVLRPVKDDDSAEYRCRVDFRAAQTRNSAVRLTVIVPAQKVYITDSYNKTPISTLGPLQEGSPLTLFCHSKGESIDRLHVGSNRLLVLFVCNEVWIELRENKLAPQHLPLENASTNNCSYPS